MSIRVVLADDQALIRAGFSALISSADDLEVVGEAASGRGIVDLVRSTRADVVVMDIRMPEVDGLEATEAISAAEDLAGVRILILTTFELDEYVVQALRAGASGFLGKSVAPTEMLEAIRVVAAGESLLSPKATRALVGRYLAQPDEGPVPTPERLNVLTDREREVVALVARGLSNDEIAGQLFVSPLTAKTHVSRAMTKLDARNRAQLVVTAYQTGLVRP